MFPGGGSVEVQDHDDSLKAHSAFRLFQEAKMVSLSDPAKKSSASPPLEM